MYVFIDLVNYSFFGVSGWGIELDYCDAEWFPLATNQDHSAVVEIAPKYCISDYFVDCESYSISSKGFLQCRRRGLDSWVGTIPWRRERLPTPVFGPGEFHRLYSPQGHRESDMAERSLLQYTGFPLCLSWSSFHVQFTLIHGLTFQVPVQCCSVWRGALLCSRKHPQLGVIPALPRCLHSFWNVFYFAPVAYWTPTAWVLGWAHLSVSYFVSFSYCSWDSQSKNAEVVCPSLLQWTTFLSELFTVTHPLWVALNDMAHSFIELHKAMIHVIILL